MNTIIGRRREQEIFNRALELKEASFIAIFGRKGVGKTYLVENYFVGKGKLFRFTRLENGSHLRQLKHFAKEISDQFRNGERVERPKHWAEAIFMLEKEISKMPKDEKIILFFDDLPWPSTLRSRLLVWLDYLWNSRLSYIPNVIFIVSGSDIPWMKENIVHSVGGLYLRLNWWLELLSQSPPNDIGPNDYL